MRSKLILFLFFCLHLPAVSQPSIKVQEKLDSLYPIAIALENPIEKRLKAYSRCCWATAYQDYNLCLKYSKEYYAIALQEQNVERQISALHFQGNAYMMLGKLKSSEDILSKALSLSLQSRIPKRIAESYGDLGNLMVKKGEVDKALIYHLRSDSVAERNNLKVARARSKINLGEIYEKNGQYKRSLQYFKEALDICDKYSFGGYKSSIHEKIGDVNSTIKEFDIAMTNYHLALTFSNRFPNVNRQISSMEKLGDMHFSQSNLDSALYYYESALHLSRKNEIPDFEASLFASISMYYRAIGNLPKARSTIEKSIQLFRSTVLFEDREQAFYYAGVIYHDMGLQELSKAALLESYELAIRSENLTIKEKSSELLAVVYKELHDYKKSTEFFERFISFREKRRGQDDVKEILRLNIQSEFKEKQIADSLNALREVELLNREHDQFKERERNKSILFYIGIGVLLLILGFTIYSLIIRRKRAIELDRKNITISSALKDKEILLKEVHHRVKNNMQVVSSLLMLKSRSTDDKAAKSALIDSQRRIDSMQLAHQKMYRNNNFEEIEIIEYTNDIFRMLLVPIKREVDDFQIVGADRILLGVEKAQAFGFVIHELVTNSIKYAWPDMRTKKIVLRFDVSEDEVNCTYNDNGVGLFEDINLEKVESFGIKMINSLITKQLQGEVEIEKGEGFTMKIRFGK